MDICKDILEEEDLLQIRRSLKSVKYLFTETEDRFIVPCSPEDEDNILSVIMEGTSYDDAERLSKQFSIKYVSRLLNLLPKLKTPSEKVEALTSAGVLFQINPTLGTKVLNMIRR